ncbi:Branched-chain amino acid aminotransferase/4-amino-4-deoxychorismate lyase [Streptomyces sp. WMMB 714]|uniref:aminotransferase class IV n=1 Tax=Streptomyces sp. WMMB 714 TaxID=1286822 RepID=UPI0005F8185F|nr:aminotransferase class IV [Streptomyces sp. WMMB 714]SCK24679.1 Branched-chain amino acid aminotransferase/4-amino-4-deoxychorismate lyase [Streptomyces sp. WMMB 714]
MKQYIEIDGRLPDDESMSQALVGYGHFTYMQVRSHAVRGLDLHLERLESGTRELFGSGLDHDRVRHYIHCALRRTSGDASVRVQVVPADPSVLMSGANDEPRVMVMVRPPAEPDYTPQRLRSVEYERPMPHIKHLDTMGLIHQTRLARQAGYDDALFTDAAGRVSEATVANIVLYDEAEEAFTWPDAPALPGIMRGLLRRGMTRLDVPVRDRPVHRSELENYSSAFLTNSINDAQPVASVDDVSFTVREPVQALLRKCHESNRWQTIKSG